MGRRVLAWQGSSGKREVVVIMQNGCHGRPRRGLFLLSRATDEPQMDGQLLRVSEPQGGGRHMGYVCVF